MSFLTDHFGSFCVCSSGAPLLPRLADVENFEANADGINEIELTWDQVPDATNYVIERSTSPSFINPDQVFSGSYGAGLFEDTGLTGNTTYLYRIKAQAAGFRDSLFVQASDTTDAAPTTETAYWGWFDTDTIPNEGAILFGQGNGAFAFGGVVTADFRANSEPKYLWMAERTTEPTKTVWYGSTLNNGPIGASETFAIKGIVGSSTGASWRVYMTTFATQQTDTPIEFRVS